MFRGKTFKKTIAFEPAPIRERLGDAGAHAIDNLQRRHLPARATVGRLCCILQRRFEGGFVLKVGGGIAAAAQGLELRGIGQSGLAQIPVCQTVDQPGRESILRADRGAFEHNLKRHFGATQSRQALRAAGAGDEPEMDFRQAHPRRWHGDAVMAAQGDLKTAPQSCPMQRGHNRFAAIFNAIDHIGQMRILHWLVKFLDIRTGRKAAPRSNDDDGRDGQICIRLHDHIAQALPHRLAQ